MPKPYKAKTDGEPATAPQKSLSDIQETLLASKNEELERVLTDAPTAAVAPQAPAPTESATPDEYSSEKYQDYWEKLPEKFRSDYATNVLRDWEQRFSQDIDPQYLPLLREVKADPKLSKIFESLTSKEKREWFADVALPIYEDPRYAPQADESAPDPKTKALEAKVEGLEQKLTLSEQQEQAKTRAAYRQSEYQALHQKYKKLQFNPEKIKWVHTGRDRDGNDVYSIAPAAGVDKSDPDVVTALRNKAVVERAEELTKRFGRFVTYAEAAEELMPMWDFQETNPPPAAIPSVSSKEVPKPQAPRTRVEARSGIAQAVQKHGNISNLARALRS